MASSRCNHCSGACIAPQQQATFMINMAMSDHAQCMRGDAWEICISPHVKHGAGEVITDKGGKFKGVLFGLN